MYRHHASSNQFLTKNCNSKLLDLRNLPIPIPRYEARLHEIQQTMTGTLVRTSPKRTLYVRALFDYDPAKGRFKGHFREFVL